MHAGRFVKARLREDGPRRTDIAILILGYKSHAGINRRHGFIRIRQVTDASSYDGGMLRRGPLDTSNTAATVGAGEPMSATGSNEPANAYRSKANETFLEKHGFRSGSIIASRRGAPWRRISGAATPAA